MKKITALFTGLILGTILHAQQVNDPNAELRDAKNFHALSISSAFDVYISQGNEEGVAVSANETKYRDRIKVEVKDGTLHIFYDNEGKWNSGNKKLKAYISVKQIDKMTISGACDVFISGTLKAEELTITQSGASDLKGKIEAGKLSVDLNGASDMLITGPATHLDVEASGASDVKYKGSGLIRDIKTSGASSISRRS